MKLTIVGCSGSLPGPDSPASCYLLEAPYQDGVFRLLLDLGSGALGALQSYVDLRSVGAVAFSHLHADHCLDLCAFFVIRKHHPDGHWGSIPVYGPPGVAGRMAAAYDIPPDPGMSAEFDFREYDGRPFTVGPFGVETAGMDHPVDAYALRISHEDRTLVYSGDTAPCPELDALATGADLLLIEAAFVEGEDNPEHLHLTGPEAAQVATRAGAGRLVLTHVPPWYDREVIRAQAAPHFAGQTDVARPGLTITV
jgi:ribonuclease BN (tRNA processing enzyme)